MPFFQGHVFLTIGLFPRRYPFCIAAIVLSLNKAICESPLPKEQIITVCFTFADKSRKCKVQGFCGICRETLHLNNRKMDSIRLRKAVFLFSADIIVKKALKIT
jgi:hypothetical protein